MVRSSLIFFFLLSVYSLIGQDIHFSQYFKSPLNLNPAMTGVMPGDCRGIVNYRNQWSSVTTPFVTASGSYEVKKYVGDNFLSYGLLIFHDRSGSQSFRNNTATFSLAYQKSIGGSFLSFGAQAGIVNKGVFNQLSFDQNYDNSIGGFNLDLDNGETNNSNDIPSIYYPDFNAGIMWYRNGERLHFWIGASGFHLTAPEESFLDKNNGWTLPMKYGSNFGFRYKLGSNWYIEPRGMLMQQSVSREVLIGGNIGWENEESGVFVGSYMRQTSNSSDALIPMAGIKMKNIEVNLSYDINTSTLVNASGSLGGYELSFVYNCASSKIYNIIVPCRRY